MTKVYAGVGSRDAPEDVLAVARHIGTRMALDGWTLSTGASWGMDEAFVCGELGVGSIDLHLPWPMFRHEAFRQENERPWPTPRTCRPSTAAYELAEKFHPAWQNCNANARALHARNSHIVLGADLDRPVDLVICWTPDGSVVGGTGQALRIAAHYGIKVRNLGSPDTMRACLEWLKK